MFGRFILATGAQEFSAERRPARLLNCLGIEGQRVTGSQPVPVGPATATSPARDDQQVRQASRDVYRETLRVLEAEFSRPINETLQQLRFHMRKQQEGESLREFLSALRALAVPANFGADTEAVIRRMFMVGAASAEIQERLVLDATLPFSVALQTIQSCAGECHGRNRRLLCGRRLHSFFGQTSAERVRSLTGLRKAASVIAQVTQGASATARSKMTSSAEVDSVRAL